MINYVVKVDGIEHKNIQADNHITAVKNIMPKEYYPQEIFGRYRGDASKLYVVTGNNETKGFVATPKHTTLIGTDSFSIIRYGKDEIEVFNYKNIPLRLYKKGTKEPLATVSPLELIKTASGEILFDLINKRQYGIITSNEATYINLGE